MAPTETTILTHYLTIAAKLPAIITLEQFTSYFPRSQQSNPQIRSLYRHLQHERNATVETVLENIAHEEKRAKAMRREAARARREATEAEPDAELEVERALFGSTVGGTPRHDLDSVIPEMDSAVASMEADIQTLEAEEAALRESIQQTVGGLSDLRYGRLSNQRLPDEVIQGLKTLQAQCDNKT
ncbi:Cnl2/NKP2 family protein-domain-containing protein [Plectosphaerella cucumerina]|jgi:centromere-localized protein 2|uniref:Cnl2/NKP2 family protein-domain-containing protein n=1 Tax=Plectosphaerella cucumerina TaxID=40658 RepID=A0A8K0TMM7_9PEZI|nr:Cnl2/NKP2 family protein-domain-containing protein [Plectosphaerella cucumerina]